MGKDFAEVTQALDVNLQHRLTDNIPKNLSDIQECIKENHKLLVKIGVVPTKVQHFISALEMQNAAAKICGAGSVLGECGGVLLVVAEESIEDIVTQYGYKLLPIDNDTRGACIIPS